jgi:hypothetical protein
MCNFKVNQRVVFVDSERPRHPDIIYPELHEIVTIANIGQIDAGGEIYCSLKEYPKSKIDEPHGILAICFRPIDETFAEETLERIMTEIKEEELVEENYNYE